MHAGNRHPVTLHYRLPTWNAFYYIRNFAEEFWTSFCRLFSRTDFKHAGKRSFRVCIEKNKNNGRQQIPVNKLVVIRHHTRVVAIPRRSDTRQRIAEHFHWLTDITCLSWNTRRYSQTFNHSVFFRPRQIFFQGVHKHNSVLFHTRYHLTPPSWLLRSHEAVSLIFADCVAKINIFYPNAVSYSHLNLRKKY